MFIVKPNPPNKDQTQQTNSNSTLKQRKLKNLIAMWDQIHLVENTDKLKSVKCVDVHIRGKIHISVFKDKSVSCFRIRPYLNIEKSINMNNVSNGGQITRKIKKGFC